MKIQKEHFDYLQSKIDAVLAKYPNVAHEYEQGQFPRSDRVKDLQERFNFDLFYGAGLSKWAADNLYTYMDDSHLSTALKRICPKVERKY